RPESAPEHAATLDRYEQLIEATRLAGREREAFDLYWYGLGGYANLARKLGEYARGYRILRSFLPESGDPSGFGVGLSDQDRSFGLNALGLIARHLGRLQEAADIRRVDDLLSRVFDDPQNNCIGLQNTSDVARDLGRLREALAAAKEALAEANR